MAEVLGFTVVEAELVVVYLLAPKRFPAETLLASLSVLVVLARTIPQPMLHPAVILPSRSLDPGHIPQTGADMVQVALMATAANLWLSTAVVEMTTLPQ